MIPLAPTPAPSGSAVPIFNGTPNVSESCKADALCTWVLDKTEIQWLANSSYGFILKPLRIVAIIVIAMLIRWLLHRGIRRLTATTSRAAMPALLKPLRERADKQEAAENTFIPERRRQRAEAIGSVLRSFVTAVVFTMAALLVMAELGFNLGPLLASAGIVGVALGFGAQSLVKDLIAGLFMLLEDQYGVGDSVDLGDAVGVVETVGLRVTTVRDMRGVLWYIRNGEIIRVGNQSQNWARSVLDIPVALDQDLRRVQEVLRDVAHDLWDDEDYRHVVLEEPEVWGVEELTPNWASVRVVLKTAPLEQWAVAREMRQRIKFRFDHEGIELAQPTAATWGQPA